MSTLYFMNAQTSIRFLLILIHLDAVPYRLQQIGRSTTQRAIQQAPIKKQNILNADARSPFR